MQAATKRCCWWSITRPTAVVLLLLLPISSGCYGYFPAGNEFPSPGTRVRLSLSTPQDVRFTEISANDVVSIDGEVVRVGTDTVVVSAFMARSASGYETLGRGESVAILRRNVAAVERSRLSVARSVGLAAIIGALSLAVGAALGAGGEGGDRGGGGGRPQ